MIRYRFRRHQHIRRGADFDRAFREGSRARTELLLVVVCENGLDHSRMGLSVGKKIWKSAVRRNRVRRVFREAFRLSQHELPPGLDVVLVPGKPRLEPKIGATCDDLRRLVTKAHRRLLEKREQRA